MFTTRKRRRTQRKDVMIEGDDQSIDIVTYEDVTVNTKRGPATKRILVPVRPLEDAHQACESQAEPDHDCMSYMHPPFDNYDEKDDEREEAIPHTRNKQQKLMEDFVSHADLLLAALLDREALPNAGICQSCPDRKKAMWRCKDCTFPPMLCRSCMRHSHMINPLHRIECWTGTFFRAADLWEVGAYMLVPHHTGIPLCETLINQKTMLESFEVAKDHEEQSLLAGGLALHSQAQTTFDIGDIDFTEGRTEEHNLPTHAMPVVDEAEMDDMPNSNSVSGREVPQHDALRNRYMRVIHTNGIHHVALVTCGCIGTDNIHADLAYSKLLPASFSKYRTIFTFQVLDDFRLSNLECKASAYQYCQKLRRLTAAMAPATASNIYQELLRMSRLWRWLKKKKWAGHGHTRDGEEEPSAVLANFCPACPQPGINLPDNWKRDSMRWVYKRFFVADGNFKADHVRQQSTSDIWLSEGCGMFSKREEYQCFLNVAHERLTVRVHFHCHIVLPIIIGGNDTKKAPCQNQFRAIQLAMMGSKACDITGIVAIACARHGCFVPNSIADLYKGEQQKNVDWVLLQALKNSQMVPEQGAMLIYDIACQYFVHLQDRIGHLLPAGLQLDRAIGLFHVHGHKDDCFFRFATSFIPGAGVTVGEILEMLWSSMNSITPTVRTATLANRAETIDDHATDSNFKKMLNITKSLSSRYLEATEMSLKASTYFSTLSASVKHEDSRQWETDIKAAEANRITDPAAMDILAAQPVSLNEPAVTHEVGQATSRAEQWIQIAIDIEEAQLQLRDELRTIPKDPREQDVKSIEKLQESIQARFLVLHSLQQAESGMSDVINYEDEDPGIFDDIEEDLLPSNSAQGSGMQEQLAEEVQYGVPDPMVPTHVADQLGPVPPAASCVPRMPSNCRVSDPIHRVIELTLRKRQAVKHLHNVREAIAEKSFQYSHVIRVAPRKSIKTRARSTIISLQRKISFHSRIYNKCRSAMVRLAADEVTLSRFGVITRDDLKSSTALLTPNLPGSTKVHLSWIWRTGTGVAAETAEALREFQRVHWLRARAQKHRWEEEVVLVGYEMQWTVRYFLHNMNQWVGRNRCRDGPDAYAARKAAMWHSMAQEAEDRFFGVNGSYARVLPST